MRYCADGRLIRRVRLFALLFALLVPWIPVSAQLTGATNQPATASLERLQGAWEGVQAGQASGEKITITITGHSLRYQGLDTNDWYEVTFTLPAKTDPEELRATITGCQQTNYIGAVVRAIFKIEGGTLTVAGIQDRDQEPPKSFSQDKPLIGTPDGPFNLAKSLPGVPDGAKAFQDNSVFRYELRKVQSQKMNAEAAASK